MPDRVLDERPVRFGNFEVDLRSGEVRKAGVKLKLSSQPFQVLTILLERPGEVVTREELQKRLWPDTYVDVDHNLNTSINKIREALGDSADRPRFVETVPRRGYRFIAPVEGGVYAAQLMQAAQAPSQALTEPSVQERSSPPSRLRATILAVFFLVVAAAAVLFFLRPARARPLTEKDTIILAEFANHTGDPVFDETLRQGLAVQLEQSPFLSLVSELRLQQILRMMGRPENARLTPAVAREICERTASAAVLDASISQLGTQYVLGLRATNCRSGRILAEEQAQVARKEDLLGALGAMARELRTRLGESLSTTEKYDTPLADATTPSLEALKAFSLGVKRYYSAEPTAGLPFFERAVELDPNFALAWAFMSCACAVQPDLAERNIRKAYALRDKVSEQERFFIDSTYDEIATGDLRKAVTVEELWSKTYPRDFDPLLGLSLDSMELGDSEAGLQWAQKALPLGTSDALSYEFLAGAYVNLNRLSEAEAVYKQEQELKLADPYLATSWYELAFLQGDRNKVTQLERSALLSQDSDDGLLASQAKTAAWYGKLKPARELTQRASSLALHNNANEPAAKYRVTLALVEVQVGNLEQARADLTAATKLANNRDVRSMAPLVMAGLGDTIEAEKLSIALGQAYPVDTQVQNYWLPAARAAIALQRNNPLHAIEILQTANALELASSDMLTAYVRGQAYLKLQDGQHATAEYQKFIDHWGLVRNSPFGALARLGLARAYVLQGDTVRAQSAYETFLTLWKDADSNTPVLKQAQSEYAQLRHSSAI